MLYTLLSGLPFFASARDLVGPEHVRDLAALVSAKAAARVQERLSALPFLVHTGGYECRLAGDQDQVDCAVAVLPGEATLPERTLRDFRETVGGAAVWTRVADFLSEWSSSSSLASSVPFACIAFDMGASVTNTLPAPCISLCLDADFFARRLGRSATSPAPLEVEALVGECHRRLCGAAAPAEITASLRRILGAGFDLEVKHLSFMLPRTPAAVKLDVRVRAGDAPDLLRAAGWEDAAAAATHITSFWSAGEHVQLNLVLGESFAGLLEVECFAGEGRPSLGARSALLTFLIANGLCHEDKARALLLLSAAPVLHLSNGASYSRNWYAKVRIAADGPRDAKAYIALTPGWNAGLVPALYLPPSAASRMFG